jgi:flagellar protein FlgJ
MSIPTSTNDSITQSLAIDPKAMASLSSRATVDPKGAVREVAQQFEAMFMNNILKAMRESDANLNPDSDEQSSDMQTWRSMLDQQLAQSLSSGSGLGLARVLEQQIGRVAHVSDGSPAALPNSNVVGAVPVPPRMLRAYQEAQAQAGAVGLAAAAAGSNSGNTEVQEDRGQGRQGGDQSLAPTSARAFVKTLLPEASQASSQLGVAPEVLVAHAALESGWGKRMIRNADGTDSHNLFSIKAGSDWHGATTNVLTTEYVNGVAQKKVDTFRSYGSYQEAFSDYANLLSSSPRYRNVLNQGRNVQGFAQGLQNGGYATDPRYAHKLVDVMSSLAQISV